MVGMMSLHQWECSRNFNKKLKMLAALQIWNNLCLSAERDLFSGWKLQGIWIPPGLYTIWVFPIIFYSNNFPRKFNNGGHHQTTLSLAWSRQEKFCLSFSNAEFYFQLWIKHFIILFFTWGWRRLTRRGS